MREDDSPSRVPLPSRTKGAQRRRRLARGIRRWDYDRQLCAEPTRRIATLTLTVKESDPEAAIGDVYRFWRRVRQQWLGTRYFCWLELQRRGAVHYHCVWINPPHVRRVNLVAWVARAWGRGRTQVRFSDGRRGLDRELEYALGYAKKMGRKSYQQRYDEVPRELRTFMSQRLEIPPRVIDDHLERDVWAYRGEALRPVGDEYGGPAASCSSLDGSPIGGPSRPGWRPLQLIEGYLEYIGRRQHVVPPGGYCTALDHRRTRTRKSPR